MVNHPNRQNCPYHVVASACFIGKFSRAADAQLVAQIWSQQHGGIVEVFEFSKAVSGLLSQWQMGFKTA